MTPQKQENLVISANATGDATLKAAVAGAYIRVLSYMIVSDAANTVTFKSNSTAITGPMSLGVNTVLADRCERPGGCLFKTAVGEALKLGLSATQIIGGYIKIETVPVTPSTL